jgi:hypothetical protein
VPFIAVLENDPQPPSLATNPALNIQDHRKLLLKFLGFHHKEARIKSKPGG